MKKYQNGMAPTIFTIFGITGDLTRRKIFPALYNLKLQGLLPEDLYIVGFARKDWSDTFLNTYIRESLLAEGKNINESVLSALLKNVYYVRGNFSEKGDYARLAQFLNSLEKKRRKHINKIFYLATAPSYYPIIFEQLGDCGLAHSGKQEQSRVLIEKPFGRDEKSARELTRILCKRFDESQIYRIDHYLGKEPVQNILSFRFANGIFENLWSREFIDNIQVSVMEDIGIEHRGRFYEETGAFLDVVQNHILQLVALITMEEPISLTAENIRQRKFEILKKSRLVSDPKYVVRGQYSKGKINGKEILAYRQEENVNPRSQVETFVALKLFVDNARWNKVPIYVRTGKRVMERFTQISVQFKQPKIHFLGHTSHKLQPNTLTLRIQPQEALSLRLMVKKPHFELQLEPVRMDFSYTNKFENQGPDAYEKIIYDAFRGDQMLFLRDDSLLAQWRIVDKLKKHWQEYPIKFYNPGDFGPKQQEQMLAQDGRSWID